MRKYVSGAVNYFQNMSPLSFGEYNERKMNFILFLLLCNFLFNFCNSVEKLRLDSHLSTIPHVSNLELTAEVKKFLKTY